MTRQDYRALLRADFEGSPFHRVGSGFYVPLAEPRCLESVFEGYFPTEDDCDGLIRSLAPLQTFTVTRYRTNFADTHRAQADHQAVQLTVIGDGARMRILGRAVPING